MKYINFVHYTSAAYSKIRFGDQVNFRCKAIKEGHVDVTESEVTKNLFVYIPVGS